MTADVVNLRQFRKRRARAEAEAGAQANRRKFGQPADVRRLDAANKHLDDMRHEGHLRHDSATADDPPRDAHDAPRRDDRQID